MVVTVYYPGSYLIGQIGVGAILHQSLHCTIVAQLGGNMEGSVVILHMRVKR